MNHEKRQKKEKKKKQQKNNNKKLNIYIKTCLNAIKKVVFCQVRL